MFLKIPHELCNYLFFETSVICVLTTIRCNKFVVGWFALKTAVIHFCNALIPLFSVFEKKKKKNYALFWRSLWFKIHLSEDQLGGGKEGGHYGWYSNSVSLNYQHHMTGPSFCVSHSRTLLRKSVLFCLL